MVLYPYQQKYLNDKSRFKAAMFARQTGKTFTTTLEAVDDCMDALARGERRRWTILSGSKAQAKEAIDEGVKLHLAAYKMGFDYIEEPFDDDVDELTYEVRFAGGSRIRAVAANPATARGKSDNMMLDEFAFHKNNRAIWRALFPIVSRKDLLLRVISTPNGFGDKFHEIMTSDRMAKRFSRHVIDIYEAVAQGLDRDIEELQDGMNDPEGWAQEFECQFIDGASSWLSYELIGAAEDELAGQPDLYEGGWCYLGMDFGRRKNLTTIFVFEDVDGVLWLREMVELEMTPFSDQLAELNRIFKTYRVVRAAMDQTGMGEMPVEQAQETHGKSRVHGVLFTGPAKMATATALKQRLEDRRIKIPPLQRLRDDLHSVTKRIGPTGIPILSAPTINGSHADRFWGAGLACLAATVEEPLDLSRIQTTKGIVVPDGRGGWTAPRKDKYRGY